MGNTHGLRHGHNRLGQRSPTYNSWHHMLQRTTNLNNARFHAYGGRGVTVSDRWNPKRGGSFANFLEYIGERPEWANGGIDRYPNPDGNYEPGNVRWATRSQQYSNRGPSRITPEQRAAASRRMMGNVPSDETRRKVSLANLGNTNASGKRTGTALANIRSASAAGRSSGPHPRKCHHVHPVGVYPDACRPTLNHKRKPAVRSS